VYSTALLRCLHPSVCNVAPAEQLPSTWPEWWGFVADGRDQLPANAEVLCRAGHDPGSLQCSRCLGGFWPQGFLCERCFAAYVVLVPLAIVVGALLLLGYLQFRLGRFRAHLEPGAAPRRAAGSTKAWMAIILFYLQVSAVVDVSTQVNAAGHADHAGKTWWKNVVAPLAALTDFRPLAVECLFGPQWTFERSAAATLLLPWTVVAIALMAAPWAGPRRRAEVRFIAVLLLDLVRSRSRACDAERR
jgi:hypothetical protein